MPHHALALAFKHRKAALPIHCGKHHIPCLQALLPQPLLQPARTATEAESPMEAERFLNRYRLDFLETLRPMDGFSEDYLFYYYLKLKLILRIRQFDAEKGEAAYRSIYRSLMDEGRSEVI